MNLNYLSQRLIIIITYLLFFSKCNCPTITTVNIILNSQVNFYHAFNNLNHLIQGRQNSHISLIKHLLLSWNLNFLKNLKYYFAHKYDNYPIQLFLVKFY